MKIGAVLAYLANMVEDMTLSKLVNMVYLIDVEFMRLRGFPITWLDYCAWDDGPASPELYALKDKCNHFSQYVETVTNNKGDLVVLPLIAIDKDPFGPFGEISDYEFTIINAILSKYSDYSSDDLSLHNTMPNSLWANTKIVNHAEFISGRSAKLLDLRDVIQGNEDLCEVYEDARWDMEFQAHLNGKA